MRQAKRLLRQTGRLPLSIVFCLLTGQRSPVLKPLASGALAALKHLKPEDETAVMVYAGSAKLLQDFTTIGVDRAAIEKASEWTATSRIF